MFRGVRTDLSLSNLCFAAEFQSIIGLHISIWMRSAQQTMRSECVPYCVLVKAFGSKGQSVDSNVSQGASYSEITWSQGTPGEGSDQKKGFVQL